MHFAALALMCAASGAEAKALDAELPKTFTRAGGLLAQEALRQDPHRVHAAQMRIIEAPHARSVALGTQADASSSPEGPTVHMVKLGDAVSIRKCEGEFKPGMTYSYVIDGGKKCPTDCDEEKEQWCEDLSEEKGKCTDKSEKCPEIHHWSQKCHCAGTNSKGEQYSYEYDCDPKKCEATCTHDERWCEELTVTREIRRGVGNIVELQDLSEGKGKCTDKTDNCPEIFHEEIHHMVAATEVCQCAGTNTNGKSYSYMYDCDPKKCPATCTNDERWCDDVNEEGGKCTHTNVDCPEIIHSVGPTIYQEAPKQTCHCAGEDTKRTSYSYNYECGNNEKGPADCENKEEQFCAYLGKCLSKTKFDDFCLKA